MKVGNEGKPTDVGKDKTYEWHWLRTRRNYELQSQILVTGDLQYIPQGTEEESSVGEPPADCLGPV